MNCRFVIIASCFLLMGRAVYAAPCTQIAARPGEWVGREVNALVLSAHSAFEKEEALPAYQKVLDGIVVTIRRCRFSQNADFVSHYKEFVEYIDEASLDRQPGHNLGFNVPDDQYFAETFKYVQIPDFLLNPGFLRSVSRYETLDKAKTFLQSLNAKRGSSDQLIFFSYISRHLGTPDNDNSYRRLLIVVPGNAALGLPDKWVQFGVTDPGVKVRTRNVSVVSTMAETDGSYNTYFKDFYRTYRPDGSISSIKGRSELGYGDDNCAQCHKSGIIPIFPETKSVSMAEQDAVKAVNERFLTYGPPHFDKYLDESKFGPGLSSASLTDRAARFGGHFRDTAVAHAMACTSCHTPNGLGYLNWPMDQVVISSYIEGGQMPLGYHLKSAERVELYDKLITEYFAVSDAQPGVLKSWLLGRLR